MGRRHRSQRHEGVLGLPGSPAAVSPVPRPSPGRTAPQNHSGSPGPAAAIAGAAGEAAVWRPGLARGLPRTWRLFCLTPRSGDTAWAARPSKQVGRGLVEAVCQPAVRLLLGSGLPGRGHSRALSGSGVREVFCKPLPPRFRRNHFTTERSDGTVGGSPREPRARGLPG